MVENASLITPDSDRIVASEDSTGDILSCLGICTCHRFLATQHSTGYFTIITSPQVPGHFLSIMSPSWVYCRQWPCSAEQKPGSREMSSSQGGPGTALLCSTGTHSPLLHCIASWLVSLTALFFGQLFPSNYESRSGVRYG